MAQRQAQRGRMALLPHLRFEEIARGLSRLPRCSCLPHAPLVGGAEDAWEETNAKAKEVAERSENDCEGSERGHGERVDDRATVVSHGPPRDPKDDQGRVMEAHTVMIRCDACDFRQEIDLMEGEEHYCQECGAPLDISEADREIYLDD